MTASCIGTRGHERIEVFLDLKYKMYSIYLIIGTYNIVLLKQGFSGTHKFYLPLLCNAPLELNAFSEDLVKLISPLAYGLVVAQIDVTKI